MHVYCVPLCLVLISCLQVSFAGSIKKRDLLQKDIKLFKELRDKLNELEKRLDGRTCNGFLRNRIGVTYTRWGKTKCPKDTSELVYSGYVGGSYYGHKGAAVDYLCMPKNPDWSGLKYKNGTSGSGGYVYGAEYETLYSNIGIDKSYNQYDVPCAVCRELGHSSVVMVPGKTKCNKSWTKQYSGYLMAGHHGHVAASQYICVDKDAERIGSSKNHNEKLLYQVEARCGALPCRPYVEGAELGCVVCTK